jgi:hypothetical protein
VHWPHEGLLPYRKQNWLYPFGALALMHAALVAVALDGVQDTHSSFVGSPDRSHTSDPLHVGFAASHCAQAYVEVDVSQYTFFGEVHLVRTAEEHTWQVSYSESVVTLSQMRPVPQSAFFVHSTHWS